MESAFMVAGLVFYPALNILCSRVLPTFWRGTLPGKDNRFITVKLVSCIQAVITIFAGIIIVRSCRKDIMKDKHWLVNGYACFGLPYFFYDIVAMYFVYAEQHSVKLDRRSEKYKISYFLRHNVAMVIHHVIFPVIFFPIIMVLRHGKGDYFVGVLYLVDISNPFIMARSVLVYLKKDHTYLYMGIGLSMIFVFFLSRLCVFPFLYWMYAGYSGKSFWTVPFNIPFHCNLGSIVFIVLQVYWLVLMIQGTRKGIRKVLSNNHPNGLLVQKKSY